MMHTQGRRVGYWAGVLLSLLIGCASEPTRTARSDAQLLAERQAADARTVEDLNVATAKLLQRTKRESDDFAAGRTRVQPGLDILVISGGADWGAFGAGFLKGWRRVPSGPLSLPHFDAVTGVSTGALIGPFAFLGDEASINAVVNLYRNPQKDLVKPRSWFSLLRGPSSYAEVPGLEQALREALDLDRIRRIAEAGDEGRVLEVNLTDVDSQQMQVWDITEEARRALQTGSADRIEQVLLASSAIPGVFPPREIDGVLYVDGGLTGNILIGGMQARTEHEGFIERWLATYPQTPLPRIRYWIIFNNELRWPPAVVPQKWSSVISASMTASTRSATVNCMRMLALQAEVARSKYHADVEVRIVAVPDGWVAPKPGTFVAESMNALADLGEKMGADPASWRTFIPEDK
jgi:predicted patatin/cPLA2 family phospholipase